MKFFHGKQCTSKDRNFNKSKAMLGHKVVSALCEDCYSKLHTQLNCFYQNLKILVCRLDWDMKDNKGLFLYTGELIFEYEHGQVSANVIYDSIVVQSEKSNVDCKNQEQTPSYLSLSKGASHWLKQNDIFKKAGNVFWKF